MATQLEKDMRRRRLMLVLALAALTMPSILFAQQTERDSASAALDTAPSAPTMQGPRNTNTPRSLMGMVMAVLIESAEQQSAAKHDPARQSDRNTDTELQPDATDPPAQASRAPEQVAVQSEP